MRTSQTLNTHLNQSPSAPAISFGGSTLTHGEIAQRSDIVASNLTKLGVAKGDVVGILLPPTPELIISILGVLKSGACFLPLDVLIPKDRLEYMVADSNAKLCISETGRGRLHVSFDKLATPGPSILNVAITAEDHAYIIYTSGTTGKPKGVVVPHGAVLNYLTFAREQYLSKSPAAFGLITSPSVDMTITSLLLPMVSANHLIIYQRGNNLKNLMAAIEDPRISWLKCTPTHLHLIPSNFVNQKVEHLVVGGEAFSIADANLAQQIFPNASIYNEYGPTEATVGCTYYRFDGNELPGSYLPIGKPIPGADLSMRNTEEGKGELLIGGAGLASHYANNPAETQSKFIEVQGKRYYRSGDLVTQRDGAWYYLGRVDDQLKISGYRVEPQEITKVLLEIPGLDRALVRKDRNRLCAYLQGTQMATHLIKEALAKKLPDWMIPEKYFQVTNWPAKNNSKLDLEEVLKSARPLEAPEVFHPADDDSKILSSLKNRVIGTTKIKHLNPDSNLFDAGLDSLQLLFLLTDLEEEHNCVIELGEVLKKPTLLGLVDAMRSQQRQIPCTEVSNYPNQGIICCFPPAIGGGMAFRQLADKIRDHTLWLFDMPASWDNALANFASKIAASAGHPIYLMGYSGGGNLAFEVCKRLESEGFPIQALILIDAYRKRQFPSSMPADLETMKLEAAASLGPHPTPKALKDLDEYYEIINFKIEDFQGEIRTDTFLITSENRQSFGDRKLGDQPFFKSWHDITTGRYQEIQGFGNHEEMLQHPHLEHNLGLLTKIFSEHAPLSQITHQ